MKQNRIILLVLVVAALIFVVYKYRKYRIAPSIKLFNQEVYDAGGKRVDLNIYKGKKLIISYYASWCGDCLREMKALDKVKTTELADVVVIMITDESVEKMISFTEKHNYPFTFYRLNKSFDKINIYSIPVTYIVNQKGELVYEKVGAIDWTDNSLLSHVKALF
jgi:peroxiredoxin